MTVPNQWWLNRKSKLGLRPLAKKPPHLPDGREWWCEPPTSIPQPEHIEYANRFLSEVLTKTGRNAHAMRTYLSIWLTAARRLLHESTEDLPDDLSTTDGLLIAACDVLHKLYGMLRLAGKDVPLEIRRVLYALEHRTAKPRRERATEFAKRTSLTLKDLGIVRRAK